MQITDEMIERFKASFPGSVSGKDLKGSFHFLPKVSVTTTLGEKVVDLLFCPEGRDGYPSRLFFSENLPTKDPTRNWNGRERIMDRNWHAMSWKIENPPPTLEALLSDHLRALL